MGDAIAGILAGTFALVVIFRQNGGEFIGLLKQEAGFLKWIIALLILLGIAKHLGKAAAPFVSLLIISMLLSEQASGGLSRAINDMTNILFGGNAPGGKNV